jgi:hypothetical protein
MKNVHWWLYCRWTDVWDVAPDWEWLLGLINIPRDYHWYASGMWE